MLFMAMAICVTVMAQGKLTPQAQLRVANQKAKVERKAALARAKGKAYTPTQQEQRVTLVVKVSDEDVAQTITQLREAGAKVLSKSGRQAVVSIPVDSVEALQRIDGVLRIDAGHKGRLKTDKTIIETGVNKIDGTMLGAQTSYTGKGVTVCLIDIGFDFQHRAFKDAEGRSRIKCVYMLGDEDGPKYTVEDDEFGTIEFPGSVYDTPELIAELTTDTPLQEHGSHTAGVAAGSRSPLGFGGMAPDANIILIAMGQLSEEDEEELGSDEVIEIALSFASTYGIDNDLMPMVLSASINSHDGPHDGTGTVPEAVSDESQFYIPVFAAGNEGMSDLHASHTFSTDDSELRLMLPILNNVEEDGDEDDDDFDLESLDEDEEDDEYTEDKPNTVTGMVAYSRTPMTGTETVTLRVALVDAESGDEVWTSKTLELKGINEETDYIMIESTEDEQLAQYFEGVVGLAGGNIDSGKLNVEVQIQGNAPDKSYNFAVIMTADADVAFDCWEASEGGFEGTELKGYTIGDTEMSAGDWSTTENVISVGAYCVNTESRTYSGILSEMEEMMDMYYDLMGSKDGIAPFSSYGEYPGGVTQPTVCAPGTDIVSSWNSYSCILPVIDEMQWQGSPYSSMSGTSQATPVVSGIIACWLQANPDMTLSDVKDVLANSSRTDSHTMPQLRWGYGKIDAAAGIEYIQTATGISDNRISNINVQPSTLYDLQGRRVSQPASGLYIQNGRKVVIK